MWTGIFPAVTTKFTEDDQLDHAEMERCFALQMDAGCDGIIVGGSLGEGPMLSHDEVLEVFKTARKVAGKKPVLLTVNEAGTREAASIARRAAKAGADGLMVVPSSIYHTNPEETVGALKAVAHAGGLPVMIYSNRVAYRVDVTVEVMQELASDPLFVAIKESSDDIRRSTDIINAFGDRFDLFTGVDNLAFEALSRRRHRLGRRSGHRLPGRDGGDLPVAEGRAAATRRWRSTAGSGRCSTSMSRPIWCRTSSSPRCWRSAPTTGCACRAGRCRATGAPWSRRSSRTRLQRGPKLPKLSVAKAA